MNRFKKIFILLFGVMACMQIQAQDKIVNPDISYAGTPRTLKIGGINVSGVEGYEDYVLTGISGLSVGDEIIRTSKFSCSIILLVSITSDILIILFAF